MFSLPNWGFRNTVHAYHLEDSVKLPLKPLSGDSDNDNKDGNGSISLKNFVNTRVPEIKDGARHNLSPYLFNGALQTLFTFKADFHKQYPVYFGREIISITKEDVASTEDIYKRLHEGSFTLDYVVDPSVDELDSEFFKKRSSETSPEGYPRLHPRCRYYTQEELDVKVKNIWLNDNQPISIILPGLAGGIQEAPIRATCHKLHKKGHHVVVLNQRGCSRSVITTPYLYNGLDTDDLKFIINKFQKIYASNNNKRQIHAIGYSFGGLQLTNYLAKEGKDSQITSAITVSSPWDLNESMKHISESFTGHFLFEPSIVFFLMKAVKSNMSVLSRNPEVYNEKVYDCLKKRIKHTIDFDDQFTAKSAGFPSGRLYYYNASPLIRMFEIKTPLLVINSMDDPIVSADYPFAEIKRHPWIYMATSDLGGHYSFIKSDRDFWFSGVIENWIDSWKELNVQNPHDIDDNA